MKLTDFLAIYAACLSSFVFLWNIRRATSRVKIQLTFGLGEIDGKSVGGIYVSVKNPSAQTVHLACISPLYPHEKVSIKLKLKHILKYRRLPWSVGWVHTSFSYYDIDDGCPLSLQPGKSHHVFIPYEKVNEILKEAERRELMAVVQDELWRDKYSNIFLVGWNSNA